MTTYTTLKLGEAAGRPVVLVPQATYHLDELVPIARELNSRGHGTTFALPEARPGPLRPLRTQHRRVGETLRALQAQGATLSGSGIPAQGVAAAAAVVVMNDWGPTRELVVAAQAVGVPTFGKVEGVQDFADVDTGARRNAYRTVDIVLCQGDSDRAALREAECRIVGSVRLERVWREPLVTAPSGGVVINLNFTYGVLTEHRRAWLRSATASCRAVGEPYVISKHIADRSFVDPRRRARRRIDDLLLDARALVTRFSGVAFDALARGVVVAYHNPHGEKVPTFQEPDGAFAHPRSTEALIDVLRNLPQPRSEVKERAERFFRRQVDMAEAAAPAARAATEIASAL